MSDYTLGADVPLGFSSALNKNEQAKTKFSQLTDKQKREIINASRRVTSKNEMQMYVDALVQE